MLALQQAECKHPSVGIILDIPAEQLINPKVICPKITLPKAYIFLA